MKAPFLLCGLLFLLPFTLQSQSRCGTVEYEKMRGSQEKKFEQWMAEKIKEDVSKKHKNEFYQTQSSYIIPVVVHVIHKGENIGEGSNISDEQIKSQIKVLNEDFQRKNADAVKTPLEFANVAGSLDIQFVLAKQTPDNQPTTGIVRVKGKQDSWSIEENAALKATSYWPAEKYLNLWVTTIGKGVLGYAQFPDYNLPGLSSDLDVYDRNEAKNRETDGVVIHYKATGSINDNSRFNLDTLYDLGRTTTHEIGHFLGLRHVWGDITDCSGTDYVNDTPPENTNYVRACPSTKQFTCGTSNMYQNYLNYTNDKCMNLFTKGQVQRMDIVLNNAPRRKELLTSSGANAPSGDAPPYDIQVVDAGPITVTCDPVYTPVVTLRSNSTIDLYKVQVKISFNGVTTTFDSNVPYIPHGKLLQLELENYNLKDGKNTFSIEVMPPNDQVDSNPSDNTFAYSVILNKSKDIIPLRENFEATPQWLSVGTNTFHWSVVKAGTNAAKAPLFDSPNQKGYLLSPVLDFSNLQKASIFFDVSYGYKIASFDTLKLLVSKDCGATYEPSPLYVKPKPANALSTATSKNSWQPAIPSDWRREFVKLTDWVNNSRLRFAFLATGNGNNIFVDNIEFFSDDNPTPVNVQPWYSVYGLPNDYRITFKLEKRQNIIIQLFSTTGQQVMQQEIPNALNQTFSLNTGYVHPGIYVLRLLGNESAATRLFVK